MASERLKTNKCKIMQYDKINQILDISFDGYGIRLMNIDISKQKLIDEKTILIKYKGEIGRPNFEIKI